MGITETFVNAAGIFFSVVIDLDIPHVCAHFLSAGIVINGSFQAAESNTIKAEDQQRDENDPENTPLYFVFKFLKFQLCHRPLYL
jgi:hypothetical protein